MTRPYRRRSKEEKDNILLAVGASAGMVKPAAARLGIPRETVAAQWNKYLDEATALADHHKDGKSLADRFLAVAIAAQDKLLELLPTETSAYRAALISGINLDKYLLLTGRPTSRTEVMKARYVEPGALRAIASTVLDVPGRVSQNPTNIAPPDSLGKVATAHRRENVTASSDGPDVAE